MHLVNFGWQQLYHFINDFKLRLNEWRQILVGCYLLLFLVLFDELAGALVAFQVLLHVLYLLLFLAGHELGEHIARLQMHVDYCLQILVFVDALGDHFNEILAELDAVFGNFVLLFEPLLGHLRSTHLHLRQTHVMQLHVDLGQLSAELHRVVVVDLVINLVVNLAQDVNSALDESERTGVVRFDDLQLLVHF